MQILRLAKQEMQQVGPQLELLGDLRINLVVVLPEVGHQETKHLFIARLFIVLIKMKLSIKKLQEFFVMEEGE
ncbi:TPA_asm: hypothetical protein G0B15_20640 [Salmonella enterica subsp. salamae serovar 58:a:-]|uniref:Uncharacterized protein n=1 Tax=Salmonella enterica subsp. salamae serovar 58:a:- TaxID=1967623 RepID=A0A701QXR0_SALER|nr:hypothetical protein [Salmonella enterica subsp. salamae]HAC6414473.1 hypothetical protein [Salmonella enterica subsp. salamae serovar 58:a:-]ECE5987648.1 hypothetical protein [Salmonella enterica subsp. salamae]ECE6783056.1 hypothetical protein [Salmonella enterica subsp. salamae]ECI4379398.1 hypothetical protein [Salmonella enterica subsp. salamae]